jgi:hypothetical protein
MPASYSGEFSAGLMSHSDGDFEIATGTQTGTPGASARFLVGSEPGGDPPKAARRRPPGTEHGHGVRSYSADSTSGNRSGRPRFRDRTLFPGGCPVLSS